MKIHDPAPRLPAGHAPAPPLVHDVLRQPGEPLPDATRATMEKRLGHDFARVRVHADARAGESARAIDALAYAAGPHVVLDRTRVPRAREDHVLAHELAHVAQQGARPAAEALAVAPHGNALERAADAALQGDAGARAARAPPGVVQRQDPAAPAPTFSVDQTRYLAMVNRAIGAMSGGIVEQETLSGHVRPLLQALAANPIWRDASGADHGGGTVAYAMPGGITLQLKLVLDDAADPDDAGHFTPSGQDAATISLRVRNNGDADTIMGTLYHEAMHLLSWLVDRPRPAFSDLRRRRHVRHLDPDNFLHANTITPRIESLARSAASRRPGAAAVTEAEARRLARWLVEEVLVRAQTEALRLAVQEERRVRSRGPHVGILTMESAAVNAGVVSRYLFVHSPSFSPLFQPGDRAGLTLVDREALALIAETLLGLYRISVRRLYARPQVHIQIPRPRIDIPITPITPPSTLWPQGAGP